MESLDVANVGLETFSPHLKSQFSVATEEGSDDIVLILEEGSEYPDLRPVDQQSGRKAFSLVFSCATHPLQQGIYHLQHESLAPFEVFLSPFEHHKNGHKLEAIFA